MSKAIKLNLALLALAGILLTPACSDNDKNTDLNIPKEVITATSSPSAQPNGGTGQTTQGGITTNDPQQTDESIQVITNDEELEEYFNSISDEEIEELFKAIEGIDISEDIDPEADPGFDDIVIP